MSIPHRWDYWKNLSLRAINSSQVLPIKLYQEQQRITHKDFVILCILSSLLNYKSRLLEWCSESRQNWPNSVINFSGAFFPYLFYLFRIYLLVSFLL